MKTGKIILFLGAVFIAFCFSECKKKNKEEEKEEEVAFDKTAMLTNYADNVILPKFQAEKTALDSLALVYTAFTQNKTVTNLQVVRQKFIRAYVKYQHISSYEFGPSEYVIVRASFDTYPADTTQINSNISSGTYDLASASNIDAKGLPALDFLFYGKGRTDADIVTLFDTHTNAANRVTYASNCIADMQNKLNTVISTWNSSYRNTFVSSTGSSIGSSLGLLVNQLDFEVDLLKNAKLGIPLGKKSLGTVLPEKCEAYYVNTISVNLAKECLNNIEDMYLGRSVSGADGSGLDDYLVALKAQHNSGTLNDAIKAQFAVAKGKLALVPEPLSVQVSTNATTVDAAYLEIQRLLVLLKTDMPSAMGIVITYQDGDGD
ncbi:MAG TPA: imelysin family protein [Bacteroidia bacterium]